MGNIDKEIVTSDSIKEDDFNISLMKSINKIIQKEEYISHIIYKRKISTEGGNYMSYLYEIDIKGKTSNGSKETNLFVKVNLPVGAITVLCPEDILSREIFVYTELAQIFEELQTEANTPDKERYTFIKCYSDENTDGLILQNMAKIGFKTYNRMEIAPLDVMELSVQKLATFHALSMIIEIKNVEFFNKKILTKTHPVFNVEDFRKFQSSMFEQSIKYLEEEDQKKLENFLPVYLDKYIRYFRENEGKIKCLCHGDFRMNNILVKDDGDVKPIIPIDYQMVYYGSPITDLLFLFFMSTDRQFRKKHMEHLKEMYYDTLKKVVKYFNIDIETIYLRTKFLDEFKQSLDFGLMVTLCIMPLLYVIEDDVPQLESDMKPFQVHDGFKERLEGAVHDFTEWGYL